MPLEVHPVCVSGFHQGVQWGLQGWCRGRWRPVGGERETPCLPGSVGVGAETHRDDGFTLAERRPGSVTPAARQGLCTGARDPSLADTPLLSTDSVDSTGPSQAVSSGEPRPGSRCPLRARTSTACAQEGPSAVSLEEPQEGAASAGHRGWLFQVVFVLLSDLSQPLPAPPFCGMQVCWRSCAEPRASLGAANENPAETLPTTQGAEPGPQVTWAQTKVAPAFLPFVPFPTEVGPGGANPESSAGLSRKFLSARGGASSRVWEEPGEIASQDALRDPESYQRPALAQATASLSYPKLMLRCFEDTQPSTREEGASEQQLGAQRGPRGLPSWATRPQSCTEEAEKRQPQGHKGVWVKPPRSPLLSAVLGLRRGRHPEAGYRRRVPGPLSRGTC